MNLSLPKDKYPYTFGILYFLFNSLFTSKVLTFTHDSIYYYDEIINHPQNFFPHHLLFTPSMSFVSNLILKIGIGSDLVAITLINTLSGSIVVFVMYKILINNFKLSKFNSRIAVLLCAFSFGFWFYNLNIETYQIPLIFLFASIFFLTREPRKKSDIILSAMFGGIAVLFHQLHGLYGLVAVIFLVSNGFKKNFKDIFIFSLIFNAIWILGYTFVIYSLGIKSTEDVFHWFFLYGYTMDGWSDFGISFFIAPFVGIVRSLVTTSGILISNRFNVSISTFFSEQNLHDDIYVVRNLTEFDFFIYLILITILASIVLYVLISNFKALNKFILQKHTVRICYIFLLVYSVFFMFWAPINLEFWIPQSLFFWIIFSISIGLIKSVKAKTSISILVTILLFTLNFRYTIILTSDIHNDIYYSEVIQASDYLPKSSVIIYDKDWIVSKYYKLFAPDLIFISYENLKNSNKCLSIETIVDSLILQGKIVAVKTELFKKDILIEIDNNIKTDTIKIGESDFYLLTLQQPGSLQPYPVGVRY